MIYLDISTSLLWLTSFSAIYLLYMALYGDESLPPGRVVALGPAEALGLRHVPPQQHRGHSQGRGQQKGQAPAPGLRRCGPKSMRF